MHARSVVVTARPSCRPLHLLRSDDLFVSGKLLDGNCPRLISSCLCRADVKPRRPNQRPTEVRVHARAARRREPKHYIYFGQGTDSRGLAIVAIAPGVGTLLRVIDVAVANRAVPPTPITAQPSALPCHACGCCSQRPKVPRSNRVTFNHLPVCVAKLSSAAWSRVSPRNATLRVSLTSSYRLGCSSRSRAWESNHLTSPAGQLCGGEPPSFLSVELSTPPTPPKSRYLRVFSLQKWPICGVGHHFTL